MVNDCGNNRIDDYGTALHIIAALRPALGRS
jgi:hypothetical protein